MAATSNQKTAINVLSAVIKLYGGDAYNDIFDAFRDASRAASSITDMVESSEALSEKLLDIIRKRAIPLS